MISNGLTKFISTYFTEYQRFITLINEVLLKLAIQQFSKQLIHAIF